MNNVYVYRHRRLDTNEIFYIGIGHKKNYLRARTIHNRNKYWKNIVNKTSFYYEIISDNLSWKEACELEKYLIAYYGRRDLGLGNLVNMTDGGEGQIGVKGHLSSQSKLVINIFTNEKYFSAKEVSKIYNYHYGSFCNKLRTLICNYTPFMYLDKWDSMNNFDKKQYLNKIKIKTNGLQKTN